MSLQEILKKELGEVKFIKVDTCKIYGNMADDLDAINKKFFNDNIPSGFGNMSYTGGTALIGQHYKTAGINGINAEKSSIVEDNQKFNFGDKNFELVKDITANKYIKSGATSNELLKADGNTINISSLPDGNIKYTPISGNLGAHYQQSALDGKSCIESNLKEDVNNFYFGNRNIKDINKISCVDISTNSGIYSTVDGFENSLLDGVKLLFQRSTNSNKISYSGMEITNDTGTTKYENQNISDDTVININSADVIASGNITANSYKIPFGTNQYVLLADGTTALYNAGGGQGNYFLYRNSTDITVPPSISGHIQYDNTVQQNAGIIWINHITQDGVDIDFYLGQILINDIIYIQDKNNSTNWIKYTINNKVQIPNNYTTLNVSFVDGEGTGLTTFNDNHPIFFTIFINQNLINQRLDALETKTRYQSSNTSNQTTFTNTLNTDIINSNHIYKIGDGEYITNTEADAVYLKIVNEANPSPITLTNSGINTSLLNSSTNPNFSTKSLSVSSGLSIIDVSNNITINNTSKASDITLGNAGINTTLIASTSSNPNFLLKSLSNGTGITLNNSGSNVEIVNNKPSTDITITDTGTGESLLNSSINPNFSTKKLISGTNVLLSSTADNITINANNNTTLTNGGANLSLIASTSLNPDFKNKSLSASTGITINDISNNLEIVNSSPASSINISPAGIATSIWKSLINPVYVSKDLISGTAIDISTTTDTIIITNNKPSTDINLNSTGSGTNSLISLSSINPNFLLKKINAGSNITISDSLDILTINASGGSSMSSGYPFNPIQNATSTILSGTKSYWYICLMPKATTISGIQLVLSGGGSDAVRCGIYRGYVDSGVSGSITLVGQTAQTTYSTGLPYNRKTIVAEVNQNLNFAVGEYMTIAFHSNGSSNSYYQNGALPALNTDIMYITSSNYAVSGFPATLTQSSIFSSLLNRVCFELY